MLETVPTPAGLKSKDGYFAYANEAYRKLVNAPHDIAGLTDSDLPCDTAQFAAEFVAQDQQAMAQNKTVTTIDIHNYAHGHDIFTFSKRPVVINGEVWGTQFQAVNLKSLVYLASRAEVIALDTNSSILSTAGGPDNITLTASQEIVLFWLLRGRQTKQIAQLIHRSPKAVEKQIANLIARFADCGVTNRASLIEYARCNGWLTLFPGQLLKTPTSVIVDTLPVV
ncbi:helix-turn-helix transcriptional regulator [Photobacterium aphoticum]|uniref:LuxR family transcriptional regulator n=2 Tax=Photobacterium aphoticum TaxID=754436 RepID=A0A0J1GN89_9GAMM|nr:PAS and helix-turn-helix domain-containing protein [Photobacterium aphoticum]KLV01185.1 LuxR family transcriptional regulator [Photobacterium aphoticum]PSU56112.1 helix-turn-helix transcriptional regulator [Photobacterium aphoticum]